ncbi:hypothetical protein LJC71_04100 [Desulfosarcina sp. OttesenSCG-928-A07]|nr:hypothetical protein [Desulfosarcina sp. OttesenSCG-928-G17]MDL2328921.1 hypothetical protein [Desulfosarcina sp. OttesenSCG-928-A07]
MNDAKLEKLVSDIEREWNWRQRELSFFKQALSSADKYQKEAISRAGILLLYSHWEGFIKKISQRFLECFINEEIDSVPDYVMVCHLARMNDSFEHKYSRVERARHSIDCISEGSKVCRSLEKVINTESNLDSKNLKKIADSVGASLSKFETRMQFIDHNFVSVRHAIAHGEGRKFTEDEFLNLERDITVLMDAFKQDVIDSALHANAFNKSGIHHRCIKLER